MTDGIEMVRLADGEWPSDDAPPGTFSFHIVKEGDVRRLRIFYECPRGNTCGVPVEGPGQHWQFDGNRDTPTLTPSINCVGGCLWHGWIRNGKMVTA